MMFWNCVSNKLCFVQQNGGACWLWSFFSLFSEGKESHQDKVISPMTLVKFFFIKIWWFILKKRYISALLVPLYHVLSYLSRVTSTGFFCVACIMFTEFTIFYRSYGKIFQPTPESKGIQNYSHFLIRKTTCFLISNAFFTSVSFLLSLLIVLYVSYT